MLDAINGSLFHLTFAYRHTSFCLRVSRMKHHVGIIASRQRLHMNSCLGMYATRSLSLFKFLLPHYAVHQIPLGC